MECSLETPRCFSFSGAVASYGFFHLAPNEWRAAQGEFVTVVPAGERAYRIVCRWNRADRSVVVEAPGLSRVAAREQEAWLGCVGRILRLEEDFSTFHKLCRSDGELKSAARVKFGRLIRSATLFEDIVKTMCTANITWKQTVGIVSRLTEKFGRVARNDKAARAFPQATELADVSEETLRRETGMGYRAAWVTELSQGVMDGSIDLESLENDDLDADELYKQLRRLKGIGDYGASNISMLLGHYDRLAVDTELIRHFTETYPKKSAKPKDIAKHYARYSPYSFLAYWWELWNDYITGEGDPSQW
jgi:3-methyladenine DNA glycosylase/8-oxoguanine DNA glycosylase